MSPDTTAEPTVESGSAANPWLADENLLAGTPATELDDTSPETDVPPATQPTTEQSQQQPEKSEDDDDPPAQGQPPRGKQPSRTSLARELEAERSRIAEIEARAKQFEDQQKLAEQRAKDLEEEMTRTREEYKTSAIPKYDPDKDPAVTAPLREIAESRSELIAEMEPEGGAKLASQWDQILLGFEQARAGNNLRWFKDKLAEEFPGENTESLYQTIKAIMPKAKAARTAREAGESTYIDTVKQTWNERRRVATEAMSRFGEWSDEEIAKNPDDAQALISAIARGNEKLRAHIKAHVPRFVPLLAGNEPLPPDATPEQIRQHRANERELEGIRAAAPAWAAERPILVAALRSAMDELKTLRARIPGAGASEPGAMFQPEPTPPAKGDITSGDAPNPFMKGL